MVMQPGVAGLTSCEAHKLANGTARWNLCVVIVSGWLTPDSPCSELLIDAESNLFN